MKPSPESSSLASPEKLPWNPDYLSGIWDDYQQPPTPLNCLRQETAGVIYLIAPRGQDLYLPKMSAQAGTQQH